MTAETLKPFITPTSAVNNFPAKHSGVTQPKRKIKHLVPIVLCIIAVALVIGIFGLTIWQTTRVQMLESDLACLKREVESLRKRLGINYLEDMNEFQKEYTNMLIQDPSKLDDIDGENEDYDDDDDDDDDDDEDYAQRPLDDQNDEDDLVIGDGDDDMDDDSDEDAGNERTTDYDEYLDMIKEETNSSIIRLPKNKTDTENASSSSVSNDDNVFEDFTNYDSKKKAQRKSRSIELRNELQSNDVAQSQNQNQNQNRIRSQSRLEQALKESSASTERVNQRTIPHRHRQLRPHSRQARQRLLVRKGESPVSARSGETQPDSYSDSGHYIPAAHFHLTDKIDHSSHQLYIGKETANTDTKWKKHFSYNRGHLRVIQPGLYYVYAQICYENPYDENGFVIYHESKPFLNCLNTVPTNMRKLHTCHTSGLIQLKENESIQLRPLLNHEDHKEILREDNNRSYIGIIKLHGQV